MAMEHPAGNSSAYLHARGLDIGPGELSRMVQHAVERLVRTLFQEDPAQDLTVAETKALERGGFDLRVRALGGDDPLLKGVADYAALLETSLTTGQAARKLGLADSRIRQRLTAQPATLYGVKLGSEWRLPLFQFDGGRLLPGLEAVVPRLDRDLHPLAVYRWFTLPNQDLVPEDVPQLPDAPLSPRDWLRLGLPPEVPARLAADL